MAGFSRMSCSGAGMLTAEGSCGRLWPRPLTLVFGTKSCRPILRRGAISTGRRFVSYALNE
jgi:hypothetical protein